MDKVVLLARLKDGARERAEQLLTPDARANTPDEDAFEQGTIFLSDHEVVFLFEGVDAAETARELLDDPVRSTVVTPWLPLFDGPLHRMHEAYSWRN